MRHSENAAHIFGHSFNCAQGVLAAFAPELGLDEKTALKIATAFGGGIGGRGLTCGAFTGALMVLGLKYGRFTAEDEAAKNTTYAKAFELEKRFQEQFASIECAELVGFDKNDQASKEAARAAGVFKEKCPHFVAVTADLLDALFAEDEA